MAGNPHRIIAVGFAGTSTGDKDDYIGVFDSDSDSFHEPDELPQIVRSGRGGILAGVSLFPHVARCQSHWGGNDAWRCRIISKRQSVNVAGREVVTGIFIPTFFGFVEKKTNDVRPASRLFHCMDLGEVGLARNQLHIMEVIQHAESLLAMCDRRGIKWAATRGSLGGKLLRKSSEWNYRQRRAAPRFINEKARDILPGNYYGLGTQAGRSHPQGIYIDQISAHHVCASELPVPHPHYLRSRGMEYGRDELRLWLRDSDRIREFLDRNTGVVSCVVTVRHIPEKVRHLYPPFMHTPGRKAIWLYTNEWEYFGQYMTLEGIRSAYTASQSDPAIREYAQWCLRELKEPGSAHRKPILLSTYGMLAMKPGKGSAVFHAGKGLNQIQIPLAGVMKAIPKRIPRIQPSIVNVIARGMIEAETRKRSLLLAQELQGQGIPVLGVYVDGLILGTDSLPFLPPGWDVKTGLTNLTFYHPNSFSSREMTKMPGVPRNVLDRRYAARRALAAVGHDRRKVTSRATTVHRIGSLAVGATVD